MPYPVSPGNDAGIIEGLNYALSGPAGLGQSLQSFSGYTDPWAKNTAGDRDPKLPVYLTGNFRIPFTQATVAQLYVPDIAIGGAEQLDDRTIKYTFAVPQIAPPFSLGNGLTISGITPSTYNNSSLRDAGSSINPIGVIECTTTYVIVRTVAALTSSLGTYVAGGTVGYSSTDTGEISTDCNALIATTAASDQVVVSGQLDQIITYTCIDPTVSFQVTVSIDRFVGTTNNDPTNPDFIFDQQFPPVIAKTYTFTGLVGTGTLPMIETVFAPVIDLPGQGLFRYFLQIRYDLIDAGRLQVVTDELSLRSLTALLLKP